MTTGYNLYLREDDASDFLPVNGVPVSDTLPLGAIVQWNGDTIPAGWQTVEPGGAVYIKKVAQPMASVNILKQTGQITLGTSSFVENTDVDYVDIPYMIELNIDEMTADDDAKVYFSVSAKEQMSNWSGFMQTMNGKLRMYWNAIPSVDVVLDNIIFQTIS